MLINRLLAGTVITPEEIARLNDAYERALSALSLVDRNDPLTEIVAKRVRSVALSATRPRFTASNRKPQAVRPPQLALSYVDLAQ
jgi:hypothetical protein